MTTMNSLDAWLDAQRINGGPHGFEVIGRERMIQVWCAARAELETALAQYKAGHACLVALYLDAIMKLERARKQNEIMGRELAAIGQYYRNDWSDFDGRTLRSELKRLATWGEMAVNGEGAEDFTEFTEMLAEQKI